MVAVIRVALLVGVIGLFTGVHAQTAPHPHDGAIRDLKSNPSERVRLSAALRLSDSNHPKARVALEEALENDASSKIRGMSAAALGKRGEKAALPTLRRLRDQETDSFVNDRIEKAIKQLGG